MKKKMRVNMQDNPKGMHFFQSNPYFIGLRLKDFAFFKMQNKNLKIF